MALMSAAPTLCSEALGKEEVQALLKEEFDVVLISMVISHCFLSIVHKMQVSLEMLYYFFSMFVCTLL